jgi:SM-20-related protein
MRYLAQTPHLPQQLYVAKGFFDVSLCRALMHEMREGSARPATISGRGGVEIVDQRRRRTDQVMVSPDGQWRVEQRLASLKPDLECHFKMKLPELQKPQYLRYGRGNFFRPHQDSSNHPDNDPNVRYRKISVVVFVNRQTRLPEDDAYCGGELRLFRLDDDPDPTFCVAGEAGMLVAFSSGVFHEVRPVTHGERFTVIAWYVDRSP